MLRELGVLLFIIAAALAVNAQRVAVLTPDNSASSSEVATRLEDSLRGSIKVLDGSLARSAFDSAEFANPFNLTTDESRRVAAAMGCDAFLLIRSAVQRRSSFERPEYYEAYAQIFLVSGRTGRLVFWTNESHEASRPDNARKALNASLSALASSIARRIKDVRESELNEPAKPAVEAITDASSASAKGLRAPIPFRRIKPDYTAIAELYETAATVEIEVDLDENGKITRTEIARWAGFGLDESVDSAVRAMSWRPAERGGKFIPMRFLLRYNFKKIAK